MTVVFQDPVHPRSMLEAICDLTSDDMTALHVAVAYVTTAGVEVLIDDLQEVVGDLAWQRAEKTLITTFDFGRTEPYALRLLVGHGFEVRIAILGLQNSGPRPDASSWHPKTYIVETPDERRALIGSANLSRRALMVNTEMGVLVAADPGGPLDASWSQLLSTSEILDEEALQRYESTRTPRPPEPVEPPAQSQSPSLADLPLFSDSVREDEIWPEEFSAFWLDAGSMSSSGSHSQLELPRYGSRFFGFNFANYDRWQRTIGELDLAVEHALWTRSIAWHGDNGMERINLPTPRMLAEEGVSFDQWADKVIMFQRAADDSFAITATETTSNTAEAWRRESFAAGRIFRLGQNSARLCGLV